MEACNAQQNKGDFSNIHLFYTNADSLRNKMDELRVRTDANLNDNKITHVIGITEVRAKNSEYVAEMCEYNLYGYNMFLNNEESINCRGVILYVSNFFEATPVEFNNKYSDAVWVSIKLINNTNMLIGCVYRSPNSTTENNSLLLNLLHEVAASKYDLILIMGDFNLPDIDWTLDNLRTSNGFSSEFVDTINDNYLYQHITRPTRAREGQKSNTLDLIITNIEEVITDMVHEAPLGKSDHAVIRTSILCIPECERSTTVKFSYDKGNYVDMRNKCKDFNWKQAFLLNDDDVDAQWEHFKHLYDGLVSEFVPVRDVNKSVKAQCDDKPDCDSKPKRVTKYGVEISKAVKRKHRLWQRYIETKDGKKYEEYRQARNKAKGLIRDFHRRIGKQIARQSKTNPKKFWAYVNSKTKFRRDIPELIESTTGKQTSNCTERAETLSRYFSSIFTQEPDITDDYAINHGSKSVLLDMVITEEQVLKKLQNIDISKSPGPDNVHPRVLKEIAIEISGILTEIFNTSIKIGKLPNDWKIADITAIYKKGNRCLPENYRPISLTSVVCKLLESLIRDNIVQHLKLNKLLSNKQFGFLKGRSTTLQLLKVLDDWTHILDSGDLIDIVYTDFQKAFDTVPHRRLLQKIKSYGISGNLLSWIDSFLSGRKQRVRIRGNTSTWNDVKSGVPQGSVLGPILFIIYINDIVENLKSDVYLYADDMKIYSRIRCDADRQRLQDDIDTVVDWTDSWLLRLNISKCKVLTVGRQDKALHPYFMNINGNVNTLSTIIQEKDLGVVVDSSLSFDLHVQEVVKKANKILGLIKRTFKYLDYTTLTLLYKSMVRSHLEYAQTVWSPYKQFSIELLERVQRRATRLLPNLRKLPYSQRLNKLKLPTLRYRRARGDMIETFKIIKGFYDQEACPALQHAIYGNTRGHSLKLFKLQANKNVRKHYFSVRIVDIWNSLPEHVVESKTVNIFKSRLDEHWRTQEVLNNYKSEIFIGNRNY